MSRKLWIVEKPDMARNLAAGLCAAYGVTSEKGPGYINLSNGDRVMPLLGHLIETLPVSAYLTEEENRLSDYLPILPITPSQFKYQPRPERDAKGEIKQRDGRPVPAQQYLVAIKEIKAAREIVNAGDVDREGQLIVDELLLEAGVDPDGGGKPVWRFPLISPKEADIVLQLQKPMDRNGDDKWRRKRMSAKARQESDWLLGMNGSMAYQSLTGIRRLSIGRVQTPVLAMVVRRDIAIEKFVPRDYFVPVITLADGTQLRWHSREDAAGTPGFDEQGRIIDENIAKQMVSLISRGMSGRISQADSRNMSVAPPLPFSLGTLQSTASRLHGLSLKEVTKAAQALYEKHKAISYVGTDCQYLPTSLLEDAQKTLENLSKAYPVVAAGANPKLVSRAWNDSKVDEHFAIIPKGTLPSGATDSERAVFDTISKRYMAQFYPNHEYISHKIAAVFGKDEFKSTRKEVVRQGWKDVESGNIDDGAEIDGPEDQSENHVATERQKGR